MSNNDTHMTRFLFAILRQKNLKDIDWNLVAQDPVLSQPISNGHAARMRYARFRSAILGIEPTKRQKGGVGKSKSTKQKKDASGSKPNTASDDPDISSAQQSTIEEPTVVKKEIQQKFPTSFPHFSPGSTPSPLSDTSDFQSRLLTPCSEDAFAMSPAAEVLAAPSAFALAMPDCSHGHDRRHSQSLDQHNHNHNYDSWNEDPTFSTFDPSYDMGAFGVGMCEHQQPHVHGLPLGLSEHLRPAVHQSGCTAFSSTGGLQPPRTDVVAIKSEFWNQTLF